MGLVAFVVNRTLLRDPAGFLRRCEAAARERGWEPWLVPGRDSLALTRRAVADGASLVFGFTLLPAARLDDGLLDVGILASSGGWGWLRAAGRVLTRAGFGHGQARRVQVSADAELPREIDGEIVAPGRALNVSVCPKALTVRLSG